MRAIVKHRKECKEVIKRTTLWKSIHRRHYVAKLLDKRYTPSEIYQYFKAFKKEVNGKLVKGYYKCTLQTIINDIHQIEIERKKWYLKNTKSYITNLSHTLSSIDSLIRKAHKLELKKIKKVGYKSAMILKQLRAIKELEFFRAKITGLIKNEFKIDQQNGDRIINVMPINEIQERYGNLKKYINKANNENVEDAEVLEDNESK